jgi:large subunit ribosomal protein L21
MKKHSSLYAIIKSGGKQYRVAEDDIIEVELLDAEPGSQVEFTDVLFVCDGSLAKIGKNALGYSVKGEMIGSVPGPKVVSMKYKPSHHQYRKFGHRQHYSRIKITGIAKG